MQRNNFEIQAYDSVIYGYFFIGFIVFMLKGGGFYQAIQKMII